MASVNNNSLNLLLTYNSSGEESEDDIPGPRVSVKRTLPTSAGVSDNRKRLATDQKKKLPSAATLLPTFLGGTSNSPDASIDQNDGRIRTFPHERGNWASFVYIAVEPSPSILSFIDVVSSMCDSSVQMERSADLHISLTKTVILKHHWIDSISSSVRKVAQSVSSFPVCFGEVKIYTNEEQTRTFIGVVITAGNEMLLTIAKRLDEVLADFKLPSFYKEASFHLSILSCVGNHAAALNLNLSRLQNCLDMFIHSSPVEWSFSVNTVHFRTGNKYFAYKFAS